MTEILQHILGSDWENSLIIIFNLILIESLLSVDNAAVIATMVLDLPPDQRKRALRYGILGAYFFRGLCLIFAAWLIKIWWLKPLGGLYLIYLAVDYFRRKAVSNYFVTINLNSSIDYCYNLIELDWLNLLNLMWLNYHSLIVNL